jgi:hypothetical protein
MLVASSIHMASKSPINTDSLTFATTLVCARERACAYAEINGQQIALTSVGFLAMGTGTRLSVV